MATLLSVSSFSSPSGRILMNRLWAMGRDFSHFFDAAGTRISRESRPHSLIRHGGIAAIVVLALAFTAGITLALGPSG